MSWCVTASCLKHRQVVFMQGWGPDAGLWCHRDGWPCVEIPDNVTVR